MAIQIKYLYALECGVTVSEQIFTKLLLNRRNFLKKRYDDLHENSREELVTNIWSETDRRNDRLYLHLRRFFYYVKNA